MLEIENFRSIDRILLKDTDYTILTGDNEILLKDICESIDIYFNGKRITKNDKEINDKPLIIQNYYSKEKEKISSKCSILIDKEKINEEMQLGSKTDLYSAFNTFFKTTLLTEPLIITINSLIQELNIEENILSFNEQLTKYSDIKYKIELEEMSIADFIKKIKIQLDFNGEDINLLSLNSFEKLKLQIGIAEKNMDSENKDKIYIFVFPEKNISIDNLKKLKNFFCMIANRNKVIIATFSKYLFNFKNLDNINIYYGDKLCNNFLADEFMDNLELNYPILKEKEDIFIKLKFVLSHYLSECLFNKTITNQFSDSDDIVYIENFEHIFLLLFYLNKSNIPYVKELKYDNSPFSEYIREKL